MGVRTKRLALFVGDANPGGTVFTCPADRTAILKDVSARNRSGAAFDLLVELDPAGAVGTAAVIFEAAVPAGAIRRYSGLFVVLEEGDLLKVTFADNTEFIASGSLLVGDPT